MTNWETSYNAISFQMCVCVCLHVEIFVCLCMFTDGFFLLKLKKLTENVMLLFVLSMNLVKTNLSGLAVIVELGSICIV